MNLYQITLPLAANDGKPLNHTAWTASALSLAGGYTALPQVSGVWLDAGKTYYDQCIPYQVACEPEQWERLIALAFTFFPDQLALFHCQLGSATIATRPTVSAAA